MRTVVVWCVVLGALVAVGHPVRAQESAEPAVPESALRNLVRALDERLTVWTAPSGRRVYVSHCRHGNGSRGCRARIVAFARLLMQSAIEFAVDPFLLAAMAVRESGLDPFATGAAGERGIVQLHPRGVGSAVRFVQSESYRRRCRASDDACQHEIVRTGAGLLSRSMARCETLGEALGMYNSGRCSETAYARRVLRERLHLLRLAKADAPTQQLFD